MESDSIVQLRTGLGWTQGQLGAAINVSAMTISRWEKGLTRPDLLRQKRLAGLCSPTAKETLTRIRPIQYLGSKLRLLDQIIERIQDTAPKAEKVCDLFSGSGVVARALADRYQVTAVDVQEFAAVLSRGLLRGQPLKTISCDSVFQEKSSFFDDVFGELIAYEAECLRAASGGDIGPLAELMEHASAAVYALGGTTPPVTVAKLLRRAVDRAGKLTAEQRRTLVIPWYYGGTYFSYAQACELASIDSRLILQTPRVGEAAIAHAALLRTASEVVGTVGKQFAQPMRITRKDGSAKPLLVSRLLADRARSVRECFLQSAEMLSTAVAQRPNAHVVQCSDFAEALMNPKLKFDCVYADPPYTIDHYSRFYHVLETMARRDSPRLAIGRKRGRDVVLRGLYRVDRLQSDFCVPRKAPSAFAALFCGVAKRGIPLVLSYSPFADSRPRLQSLETLRKQAKEVFRSVEVVEAAPHVHRKLNAHERNVDAPERSEVFLICRNPHG